MSGPIGNTFIYNIIIIFIVIVFGFLAGTMSYYKAFKINNRIVASIEKFEGYNTNVSGIGSVDEINKVLATFGYSIAEPGFSCPSEYKGMSLHTGDSDVGGRNPYRYCIYLDNPNPASGTYYKYGVLTYMTIDLPIINKINIPVYTKTNSIYKF